MFLASARKMRPKSSMVSPGRTVARADASQGRHFGAIQPFDSQLSKVKELCFMASGKAIGEDDGMDEFIEQFKEKKYEDGFTQENWEEEFEKIPMFMKKAPGELDPIKHPELACIQSLLYDEDQSPEELAKKYKNEGNQYFKEKNYKKAIVSYTEGLKRKCTDTELNVILYTNRAAAQFYLGNNRSALNDAIAARKLKPNHLKAIIRGALCHTELKNYSYAITWCDEGLQIESKEKQLLELRAKADKQKRIEERNLRKANLREKKERVQAQALLKAIQERKIKLFRSPELAGQNSDEDIEKEDNSVLRELFNGVNAENGHVVRLNENGSLIWPVLFLYPEYEQMDMISSFHEDTRFIDHLSVMFGENLPPWDTEKKYEPANLKLYFEDEQAGDLFLVDPLCTLRQLLSHPRYVVKAGNPRILILVGGSSFCEDFLLGKNLQENKLV
ncbi:LOW QUALITY PROTEIN: tetratricopeptide repeat protein 4 [Narcine bancroftii]|uniref:LOW QUALITY PROTEIN: tetratricopeptide repeat protein 4 n=1 Tax=Narcine bancroftii TaxID=1343680 RepID=UPI003831D037